MLNQWIKGKGIIRYSPLRIGGRRRINPWWIVVDTDNEISKYYKWWLERLIYNPPWLKKNEGEKLNLPLWGTHVTVLNGVKEVGEQYLEFWEKYQGEQIEFEYSPYIEKHWKFFVLPVKCSKLEIIRDELGFDSNYHFHITVARQQ